jgi:Zn-finger nucleic acid-binding protein
MSYTKDVDNDTCPYCGATCKDIFSKESQKGPYGICGVCGASYITVQLWDENLQQCPECSAGIRRCGSEPRAEHSTQG